MEILSPSQWRDMVETPNPKQVGSREGLIASPKEAICSFCGVAMHSYKDCPMMYQYLQEQADVLAQKRIEEYHGLHEWARYESPRQIPSRHKPVFGGTS